MNTTPKSICGMDQTGWVRCKNPLRMPKVVRGRLVPRRKFALLVCAYVLDSPAAFPGGLTRRVARVAQAQWLRSHPRTCSGVTVGDALRQAFPDELTLLTSSQIVPSGRPRATPEYGQLYQLLSAVAVPAPPTRGTVNQVAESCLRSARDEARAEVRRHLDALRAGFIAERRRVDPPPPPRPGWRGWLERMLPAFSPPRRSPVSPLPPDFRSAVLGLLPEAERGGFATLPWSNDQVPPAIVNRLGTLAADARAAEAGAKLADVVREVVGNPFRPLNVLPAWRESNFGAALRIAEHVVNSGDYSHVPILADALEDAGCDDAELLAHCRTGEHVPGCWAVDAVLGWN